jgi:hypothetical protein
VQPTQQSQQQQPQQQIQYGPIGQAATSSSDLLKNLLASTQQSMPFDFTANNPYLMKQQPVQFFAEGGEATPPLSSLELKQQRYANLDSFKSLENELSGLAQDQYRKQLGYAQALRDEAQRAPLSTGLGNPRKAQTAADKELRRAARVAGEQLKANLDYLTSVRNDLYTGVRTDLSGIALPYVYSFENNAPELVGSSPAPAAPSPLVTPQPQQPVQEQPVPVVPREPLPTEVPRPSISGVSLSPQPVPSQPQFTTPNIPVTNLTPRPLPTPTPTPIGGIPQPSIGYQNPLYQSLLPQYQSPTSTAMQPTNQQQSQQPQFQYGPIGQAAVGQTNLLSTLLSQQQDPTQVSLLGFDNPYLMKPFG